MGKKAQKSAGPRILLVGPGAIGTVLAVRLALGGAAVTVLDHRPRRAQRIRRDGLRLRAAEGLLRAAVSTTTTLKGIEPPELVLVCVKCPALEAAGGVLAHLAAPTIIVTIQNGLGVMEALKRGLGSAAARHKLVAAVTYQAASPAADGTIRHVANLETLFDGAAGLRPAASRAAAIFKSAGLPARVVADLRPHVWRKLIANAAINPLTALERVANGVLEERGDLRRDMLALARETALLARAEGFDISNDEAEKVALRAAQKTADNISSMRQDVEARRATEIEFLGGAVLRLAARHGLSLPRTSDVTQALRRLEPQKD